MTTEPLKGNNRRIIALAEERLKVRIIDRLEDARPSHPFTDGDTIRDMTIDHAIDIIKNITTKR